MRHLKHFAHAKTAVLPISMIIGAVFYPWMGKITFLSPYLIFMMLFITYCKLDFRDLKLSRFEYILICVQMLMAAAAWFLLSPLNHIVAQGVFICFYITTATAAPVITAMLGGSISKVASFSLFGNMLMAVTGPIILALVGDHSEFTFMQSFLMILQKVFPLLIAPLICALLLRYAMPKLHAKVVKMQKLSFYLWAISLVIVVGSCVSFTILHWNDRNALDIFLLAFGALLACLIQFRVGKMIGGRYGDRISGGQALGQKNTVLAVWLALAYMNPLASIAPAAYIAWQNIMNSWQLIKKERKSGL